MSNLTDAMITVLSDSPHPSGALDTHAHASEAGMCARAIWYRARLIPKSDRDPLTSLLAMRIGSHLHKDVQAAIALLYPEARIEVEWDLGGMRGHADAVYPKPGGGFTVLELKTAGPFAWKYMQAPKREHLLQGQLNVLGTGADELHIVYLNISAKARTDPTLEFFLAPDPDLGRIELARQEAILAHKTKPVREYDGVEISPHYAEFPCTYCSWQAQCVGDGA